METLHSIYETLRPHAATITSTGALVATWVALFFAWRRRKKEWFRKEFLTQVNFSLNLFGETLAMPMCRLGCRRATFDDLASNCRH